MATLPKKAHWPPSYIYLQTIAIAIAVWIMTYARYQDDAYITLTYARNLLDGKGLVWNGSERIEGYSNFLFLILTAALGRAGIDLVVATKIISFVAFFSLIAVLYMFTQHTFHKRFAHTTHSYAHRINAALCVSLVASAAIVLAWCFGGLETVLFAALLTAAICRILWWMEYGITARLAFHTGILFALAAMTRIEGATVWGATGLFLGLLWLTRNSALIRLPHLLLLGLGFLALFAPYMGWRLWYFGEWLPNTYYAKLYGISPETLHFTGMFYFMQFLVMPPMLPLVAVGLLFITWKHHRLSPPLVYLFLLAMLLCAQVIKAGGDHMYYLRFFVPVVPIIALIIYYANAALIAHNEKHFRDICGALIVLSVLQFGMVKTDESNSPGAVSGIAVAPHIKEHWPEGTLIALNPLGALPYYAPDFQYLDMIGLLDKHIAHRSFTTPEEKQMVAGLPVGHQKGDGKYVLSRKPDYIIFGNVAWGTEKPVNVSDQELAALPEFANNYTRVETYISPSTSTLPALQYMAQQNLEEWKKGGEKPDFIRNPVLNAQNQLRFIYYQRNKDSNETLNY